MPCRLKKLKRFSRRMMCCSNLLCFVSVVTGIIAHTQWGTCWGGGMDTLPAHQDQRYFLWNADRSTADLFSAAEHRPELGISQVPSESRKHSGISWDLTKHKAFCFNYVNIARIYDISRLALYKCWRRADWWWQLIHLSAVKSLMGAVLSECTLLVTHGGLEQSTQGVREKWINHETQSEAVSLLWQFYSHRGYCDYYE